MRGRAVCREATDAKRQPGNGALADRCLETTTRDQQQKRNRKLKMRKARLIAIGLATLGALAGAQPAFADCRSDSIACNANGAGAWCAQKKGNSGQNQ